MDATPRTTGAPDFVGVGTQRSGTTWWFRILVDHPDIRPPKGRRKEQHFFDVFGEREMTPADVEAYHARFPRKPGQIAGEWTPRYMRDIWTPRLLARAAPRAKLLVMLRDPIERYRSGVVHKVARAPGRGQDWFATDAIERGRYAQQLQRLLGHFDREQILVLQFERCRAEPLEQYRRTLRFLGVDASHVPEDLERPRGTTMASEKIELWPDFTATLQAVLAPDVAQLGELVPDLDLALWPNFAQLGHEAPPAPVRPRIELPAQRAAGPGPPDFVGVGTSYSGVEWFYDLLLAHPDVDGPRGAEKDAQFFGQFCTRPMTDADVAAYHRLFDRPPGRLAGEWTHRYIYDVWTAPLLRRAAPAAKLLVLVSDPIERHRVRVALERHQPREGEGEMFMVDPVARGRYATQLRNLLEHFGREQVLVLQFERCLQDPRGEYARTLRFLGLRDGFTPPQLRPLGRAAAAGAA